MSAAVLRARPTPSPIVRVLNQDVRRYHRWCTPSILEDQERVEDFYGSDVSISAGFFGTLVDHTGVFGEAERFAAGAQGADRTMFSVHGSSGSNWIVLRALALERSDALVLVARNIHHSVINAIKAFGLDFRFLPTPYEPRFEAVLPPSADDVLDALTRYPEALAVLYTSPTYEGLAANTRAIALVNTFLIAAVSRCAESRGAPDGVAIVDAWRSGESRATCSASTA